MRIALGIEYKGQDFYGWQAQENLPTIQNEIEKALSKIADHPVTLVCAGRTDAGVNALGQVAHFDTHQIRDKRAWVLGTNSHLPSSIAIRFAQEMPDDFHARFSALSRCYQYVIYNAPTRPAIFSHCVTWMYEDLNTKTMQEAANYLLGEQDFTSFRSSECESKTPMREVKKINVLRMKEYVIIEIEANAFLHHMVRNIVGSLIAVGTGLYEPIWLNEVLLAKDRRKAGKTSAASGLYLNFVRYPAKYNLSMTPSIFFVL